MTDPEQTPAPDATPDATEENTYFAPTPNQVRLTLEFINCGTGAPEETPFPHKKVGAVLEVPLPHAYTEFARQLAEVVERTVTIELGSAFVLPEMTEEA